MDKNRIFLVKNRSASVAIYNIPEDNIRREFAPGEPKKISFEELEKLSYQPGGRELMANFLQITEEAATEALGIHREPEYNLSEEQIKANKEHDFSNTWFAYVYWRMLGLISQEDAFAYNLEKNS